MASLSPAQAGPQEALLRAFVPSLSGPLGVFFAGRLVFFWGAVLA